MEEDSPIIASEKKYKVLFELATDAILTVRPPEGNIIDSNLAAESLLGYSKEALRELSGFDIIAPEIYDETQDQWMTQVEEQGYFRIETLWVCQDGSRVPVAVSGKPLEINGEDYFQLIGHDITHIKEKEAELRESQAFLQAIFDNSLNAIIVADDLGYYRMVNKAAAEMFGYSVEQLLNMNVSQLRTPEQTTSSERYKQFLEKGSEVDEFNFIHASGEVRIAQYHAVHIDKDFNLSILTDVTERKKEEAELHRISKLESLGVLAGGIAHDFNNLLTGLFSNVELAKMLLPSGHRAKRYLESALNSMDIAVHLTQQMLTFAKGGDPIKETFSIGEIITETARFALRGSSTKLRTRIEPDLWLVEADRGQLSQVISNLVINANQAMPMGGNVTVTAKNTTTEEGEFVEITVQDEGIGIAPQFLDSVFDPYFSTKQKGSGLGLAVVYSIIKKHNGRIHVDSQLNQGTTFTIHLPAILETEKSLTDKHLFQKDALIDLPVNILVLEDEELLRESIGHILEVLGYTVSFAAEGGEAIDKYRTVYEQEEPYNLVLVDLTIPGGMGGEQAAKGILDIDPQAKLIVSSGYANDPIMANYEAYGFKGMIKKPYRMIELKRVVEEVLLGNN